MARAQNIAGSYHSPAPLSDSEDLVVLIRECIADNRTSQKKLYDKYAPMMFGVVKRYVNDQDVAKEILNDVFFRVFTRLPQYSFEGAFEGWMRRIAVNIISDHFRKNAKHSVISDKEIETIDPHVDSSTIGNINYKQLLQLVHELPDTHRAVFNLHIFEDYSHKEIADLIGITENNSRWHLNDARRRLKEKIKNMNL